MELKRIAWIRKCGYFIRNIREKTSFKSGSNNIIINNGGVRIGSKIQIIGNCNKVILEKGSLLYNSRVKILGNNNTVTLKANSYIQGAEIWVGDNRCKVIIGEHTFIGNHTHLACTEDGSKLTIGKNGMISSYVQVRTGDSHSIVDMEGNRINKAQSVFIGDHCWLGEGSKVLKGVTLEGDVIVSTGAIVTKSFGKNVLLGGVPAKILKENVNWQE